jgi:hypothetical protein
MFRIAVREVHNLLNTTIVFEPGACSRQSRYTRCWGSFFPEIRGFRTAVSIRTTTTFPRLGFAYDASGNGRTVFHGGAGLFFDTISGNEWMLSQNFQPFAVRETNAFTHVVSLQNIYSTDCQDFAGCVSPFPYLYDKINPRYIFPASLVFLQKGMRWPYNYQLNFGMQHQFTNDFALSVNYVGAFSRKLPLYIDNKAPIYNTQNPALNTTANVNCRRPFDTLPFAKGHPAPILRRDRST